MLSQPGFFLLIRYWADELSCNYSVIYLGVANARLCGPEIDAYHPIVAMYKNLIISNMKLVPSRP